MGRRTIKVNFSEHAPLGIEDEFEPAIVRALGALGQRRVLRFGGGRRGAGLPLLSELHRTNARAAVNRIVAASLRPRVSIEAIDGLSGRDRLRVIRALVDVNGVEREYEAMYGSYVGFDERLLVALRRARDRERGDLRERLLGARAAHDRIALRADAYVLPKARQDEITRASRRMTEQVLGPVKTLERVYRVSDMIGQIGRMPVGPVVNAEVVDIGQRVSRALAPAIYKQSYLSKGFAAAALGGHHKALAANPLLKQHAVGVDFGLAETVARSFGKARFATGFDIAARYDMAALVGRHRMPVALDALRGVPDIARLMGLEKIGIASTFSGAHLKGLRAVVGTPLIKGFQPVKPIGVPGTLARWAREHARLRVAALRQRYRRELFGLVLEVEDDFALLALEELDDAALEEAVFAGLEVMVADPEFGRRLRAIADDTALFHREVSALAEGGLEHAHRAVRASDPDTRADEWVKAQTLLTGAVESMLFSELENTGRAIRKGGKVLLVETNKKLGSVEPVAQALLAGTDHEHLLEAIAPVLWKHTGAAFRHHRSWVGEVRSMGMMALLAILNLLARHHPDAIEDLLREELGPLEQAGVDAVIDGVAVTIE